MRKQTAIKVSLLSFLVLCLQGCGLISGELKKYHKGDKASDKDKAAAENVAADLNGDSIVPYKCKVEKTNNAKSAQAFRMITGVNASEDEKKKYAAKDFDYDKYVDELLGSFQAFYVVDKLMYNALDLKEIDVDPNIDDDDDAARVADAKIVADLKKEPGHFAWSLFDEELTKFFTEEHTYMTENTAPLYGQTITGQSGFHKRKMPKDRRAGILGTVAFNRANSSSIYSENNNYKRVKMAVYLMKGIKLLAAGVPENPQAGKGRPLDSCVTEDRRTTPDGLIIGTNIAEVDASCAECHSSLYHAGIKQIFTRIGPLGKSYTLTDIDNMGNNELTDVGLTRPQAEKYLNTQTQSCWTAKKGLPPKKYKGMPQFGKLVAEHVIELCKAFANIVPIEVGNEKPNANSVSTMLKFCKDGKKSLKNVIEGYFKSQSFACEIGEDAGKDKS